MVRNLNQMTFQGFGTVPPERSQVTYIDKNTAATWPLTDSEGEVCRTVCDTWVTFGAGMSVLSVSADGENYQHYYLDKPVCIRKGTLFALSAFQGESTALLSAADAPEKTGKSISHNLRSENQVRVDGIYTFFYHEKEQGFLFPGESHPMVELTYVDQGAMHSVVNGQDLLLKQGDLVIYGPDQWHMQYAEIGVAPRYVTISFELNGVDLTPLLNRRFAAPQSVVKVLQNMLREQERMDAYSNEIILSDLKILLLLLLRETIAPRGGKLQTSNAIHAENEIICQAQQPKAHLTSDSRMSGSR